MYRLSINIGLWSLSCNKKPTCGDPAPLSDGLTWTGKTKLYKLLFICWYILFYLFDKFKVNVYKLVDTIPIAVVMSALVINVQYI